MMMAEATQMILETFIILYKILKALAYYPPPPPTLLALNKYFSLMVQTH